MKSNVPKKQIGEFLTTIYQVNEQGPIKQLDDYFSAFNDIGTLRELHAEATVRIEKEGFFLQFGFGPVTAACFAIIAAFVAIEHKIPGALWAATFLILFLIGMVSILTIRDKKKHLAHLLIREAIDRRIKVLEHCYPVKCPGNTEIQNENGSTSSTPTSTP